MTVLTAEQRFIGDKDQVPSLQARLACRAGMATTTAGVASGFVQGNLAILPEKLAASFHRFCQLNPKPCPVIGMSDVGDPRIPSLGIDLDIRTDLPRYRVWRDGEVAAVAASHPDPAELVDLQLRMGVGPLLLAAREGTPVSSADTLTEECGGQPAALVLVGGWLATRPKSSVADVTKQLWSLPDDAEEPKSAFPA